MLLILEAIITGDKEIETLKKDGKISKGMMQMIYLLTSLTMENKLGSACIRCGMEKRTEGTDYKNDYKNDYILGGKEVEELDFVSYES